MPQPTDPAIATADAFYAADQAFDEALHSDKPWAGELAYASRLEAETLFQEAVPTSRLGATLKLAHATGALLEVLRQGAAQDIANVAPALRRISEAMSRLSGNKADPLSPLRRAHELLFLCPSDEDLNSARCHVRTVIEGLSRPRLAELLRGHGEAQDWLVIELASAGLPPVPSSGYEVAG